MKRMIVMAAAAVGILALADSVQAAGPGPRGGAVAGGCDSGSCYGPRSDHGGRYGLHPFLSRGSWGKKAGGCDTCGVGGGKLGLGGHGCGAGGCGAPSPYAGAPGYPGGPMPGTLVFPNHPYVRSPRDFFMVQPR